MKRRVLVFVCVLGVIATSGCGGGTSRMQSSDPLTGNWQWTMTTSPNQGGLTSGFLLQKESTVTGSLVYSTMGSVSGSECAAGSAPVTGTLNGQNVTLTATAGSQTFSFTGTLSSDGSTIGPGTYTSTAGASMPDGGTCGVAQPGASWGAILIPSVTGSFQGTLHSSLVFSGEVFPVSGSLTQGDNIGADHATVTGTLTVMGYPCFANAALTGTISGNTVALNIIGTDGNVIGYIGQIQGLTSTSAPAILQPASHGSGLILLSSSNSSGAYGYGVTNNKCPLPVSGTPGDYGNVCFGLGTATGCSEPIQLSANTLTFAAQVLGTAPTTQSIIVTNTDPLGSTQNLTLSFNGGGGQSDFTLQPDFIEQDTCGTSLPSNPNFTLAPNQSCTIYITFSPQESCPWDPRAVPPLKCPDPLTGSVAVTSPISVDGNAQFSTNFTGTGLSAIVASIGELDFSGEAVGETSDAQTIIFTNQAPYSVQILPLGPCVEPLPRPLTLGSAPGLQVVNLAQGILTNSPCDTTPPNFPITVDNCSGLLLQPQEPCTVSISYAPQPNGLLATDLELNTLQCTSTTTTDCELDAGRFPVVLNANGDNSPLRLIPAASLTFPAQVVGTSSAPQSLTIYNDPNDPNPGTVSLKIPVVNGSDFTQTNDCGSSLALGRSCTVTVIFTPTRTRLRQATIAIPNGLTGANMGPIYLRGQGK